MSETWKTETTQTRACWFKAGTKSPAKAGLFHAWSQSFEELQGGVGHFPVAIVESQNNADLGAIHVVDARLVSFGKEPKFS